MANRLIVEKKNYRIVRQEGKNLFQNIYVPCFIIEKTIEKDALGVEKWERVLFSDLENEEFSFILVMMAEVGKDAVSL